MQPHQPSALILVMLGHFEFEILLFSALPFSAGKIITRGYESCKYLDVLWKNRFSKEIWRKLLS